MGSYTELFTPSNQNFIDIDDTDPNKKIYVIRATGIYLSDSKLSKEIFNEVDKLCNFIADKYEAKETDTIDIPVDDLLNAININIDRYEILHIILRSYAQISGTTDIKIKAAVITSSDHIYGCTNVSAYLKKQLSNRFSAEFTTDKTDNKPHKNSEINASKRESILGASLAVLAKYPEECRTKSNGTLKGILIAKQIDIHSYRIFQDDPPLSIDNMSREINKWIKLFN